jgi:hypothetical protein
VDDFAQENAEHHFSAYSSQLHISYAHLQDLPPSSQLSFSDNHLEDQLFLDPSFRWDEGLQPFNLSFPIEGFSAEVVTPGSITTSDTRQPETDNHGSSPVSHTSYRSDPSPVSGPSLSGTESKSTILHPCPDCPNLPPFRERHKYR